MEIGFRTSLFLGGMSSVLEPLAPVSQSFPFSGADFFANSPVFYPSSPTFVVASRNFAPKNKIREIVGDFLNYKHWTDDELAQTILEHGGRVKRMARAFGAEPSGIFRRIRLASPDSPLAVFRRKKFSDRQWMKAYVQARGNRIHIAQILGVSVGVMETNIQRLKGLEWFREFEKIVHSKEISGDQRKALRRLLAKIFPLAPKPDLVPPPEPKYRIDETSLLAALKKSGGSVCLAAKDMNIPWQALVWFIGKVPPNSPLARYKSPDDPTVADLLRRFGGNRTQAALYLGVDSCTVSHRIHRCDPDSPLMAYLSPIERAAREGRRSIHINLR